MVSPNQTLTAAESGIQPASQEIALHERTESRVMRRIRAAKLIAAYGAKQVNSAFRGRPHLLGQLYNLAWLDAPAKKLPSVTLEEMFPGISMNPVLLHPAVSPGSVNLEELCTLALLCRWLKAERVFEIGTLDGRTTMNLAANTPPDTRVFTLDLPPTNTGALPIAAGDELYKAASESNMLYSRSPYKDKVVQLWSDSATFDVTPLRHSVDMVFIDGSHSYNYVRNDTEKALQVVRDGGVILWHDYTVFWPGVIRYLHELSAKYPVKHLSGTRIAILQVNESGSSGTR